MKENKLKSLLDITIILLTIIIAIFLINDYQNTTEKTLDKTPKPYFRPVNAETDLIFGNPNAELFIIEYGDMECPHCQSFHKEIKNVIQSPWGKSGKVAWVWRNGFHINETSIRKATALECIKKEVGLENQKVVWNFLDETFKLEVGLDEYPKEEYREIFKNLGLNVNNIENCVNRNEVEKEIAFSSYEILLLKSNIQATSPNETYQTPFLQFSIDNVSILSKSGSIERSFIEDNISDILSSRIDNL